MFIETERLIIRSIEPMDEQAYIDMASDGSLQDIFGDCSDCREWMGTWIQEARALDRQNNPAREYLAYTVTDKQRGIPLGSVGCSYYEDLKQVGIVYFIGSAFRGQGYAAEAATAYAQYFFTHYDIHKLIATVRENNAAFQKCEPLDMLWDNSLLDEMNGWIRESMEKNGWQRISKEEYEQVVSQLTAVYDQLPVQLIHRDIHFGNFLFADGVFSGYIDFDLSQRNIRIFDLCYFLLGLLSEEEGLKMTGETWFGFLRDVFAGYESILKLSEAEKKAVPYVMECIELLFIAYFDNEKDDSCAENACEMYKFVRRWEDRIGKSL